MPDDKRTSMMHRILQGLLVATAMWLGGCQAQQQTTVAFPQLTMGQAASHYLHVESIHAGVTSGNLMKVGVYLYNRSGFSETLRYRFIWLDRDGFAIPGLAARWEKQVLRPSEPNMIGRIAPNPLAVSYRILLFDNNEAARPTPTNYRHE